ncbi:hypothetical protein G6F62_015489 [Rhizopus arrhizus]|nr:hypothetical protein G6F62_015489 [Rhizopus arrhizus]
MSAWRAPAVSRRQRAARCGTRPLSASSSRIVLTVAGSARLAYRWFTMRSARWPGDEAPSTTASTSSGAGSRWRASKASNTASLLEKWA